jgi:hypothetical protein
VLLDALVVLAEAEVEGLVLEVTVVRGVLAVVVELPLLVPLDAGGAAVVLPSSISMDAYKRLTTDARETRGIGEIGG